MGLRHQLQAGICSTQRAHPTHKETYIQDNTGLRVHPQQNVQPREKPRHITTTAKQGKAHRIHRKDQRIGASEERKVDRIHGKDQRIGAAEKGKVDRIHWKDQGIGAESQGISATEERKAHRIHGKDKRIGAKSQGIGTAKEGKIDRIHGKDERIGAESQGIGQRAGSLKETQICCFPVINLCNIHST